MPKYSLLPNCPHAAFADGEFIDQLENEKEIEKFKQQYKGYDVQIYTRRDESTILISKEDYERTKEWLNFEP